MTTEIIPVERILGTVTVEPVKTSFTPNQEGNPIVPETQDMSKIRLNCSPGWFVWDGLGITCAGITYGLIGFAEFVVVCVILLPEISASSWGYVHVVVFTILALLALVAHIRAMTTDPGTIPRGNFTESNIRSLGLKAGDVVVRCTKCECIKVSRAHHCSTCKRCIRFIYFEYGKNTIDTYSSGKMDHHCPWINNCVGEYNQKFFMLFTFYIMSISAYALGLAIRYIFVCATKDWEDCAYFSPPATIVFVVFLVFEGLLFGIFTLVMLCTQVNAVVTDETGIEHLKKEDVTREGNWRTRLQDVFGGNFSLGWLSPFSGVPAHRRSEYIYREV